MKCTFPRRTENMSIVRRTKCRFLQYNSDTLSYLSSARCTFLWDKRHIRNFLPQMCIFPHRTENMPMFRSNQNMFLQYNSHIWNYLSRTRCRFPWDTCHIQIFHRTKCIHRQYIHDMWKNHLWRCTLQHCSSNTFLPIHRQTQHCMYLCSSAKRELVLPEHSSGIIAREGYERVTRMRVVQVTRESPLE